MVGLRNEILEIRKQDEFRA